MLLLLVIFVLGASLTCDDLGGDVHDFDVIGPMCYKFYYSGKNLPEARMACKDVFHSASDVPSIHSMEDNDFVASFCAFNATGDATFPCSDGALPAARHSSWIGFTDSMKEGWQNWRWTDGSEVTYTGFESPAPLDWPSRGSPASVFAGQDCAILPEPSLSSNWTEMVCTMSSIQYMCVVSLDALNRTEAINPISNVICTTNADCWCDFSRWECPGWNAGECNGIPYNDPRVCSGHGDCVYGDEVTKTVGTCDCDPNYTSDTWCAVWTCNGTNADETTVCNGHGECLEHDVCECNEHYRGQFCDVPVCYGIRGDNVSVCSNMHGICTDDSASEPYCSCGRCYFGTRCEFNVTCAGIVCGAPDVCSGFGQCAYSTNNCTCEIGHSGEWCHLFSCDGTWSDDSENVCSGHGECTDVDVCNCTSLYSDEWCQTKTKCGDIDFDNETFVCSGRGDCMGSDTCVCDSPHHTGSECELPVCYGLSGDSPLVCSGRGECVDSYPSPYCVCNDPLHHSGATCERDLTCGGLLFNDTQVCSGKGNCTFTRDNCTCEPGYTGQLCDGVSELDSDNVCSGHGKCTGVNVCSNCTSQFYGQYCNSKVLCGEVEFDSPSACSGRGVCVANQTCVCNSGHFTGDLCERHLCSGILSTSPSVCSNRTGSCVVLNNGTTNKPTMCACDPDHHGKNCERNVTCAFLNYDHPQVCSSHGTCTFVNDNCTCFGGWGGKFCQSVQCRSVVATDMTNVCSGHGVCVSMDNCSCTSGFSGEWCEQPVNCSDVSHEDTETVCSGRGVCLGGECQCSSPIYSGNNCELFGCFGVSAVSHQVCSGHGMCESYNICHCEKGFSGTNCGEYVKDGTATLSGLTTDLSFSVLLGYITPVSTIPPSELPLGQTFDCYDRLLSSSTTILGSTATCSWQGTAGEQVTSGLNLVITPCCTIFDSCSECTVFQAGVNQVELEMNLLQPTANSTVLSVNLTVSILSPGKFNSGIFAAVAVPVFLLVGGLCIGLWVVSACAVLAWRRNKGLQRVAAGASSLPAEPPGGVDEKVESEESSAVPKEEAEESEAPEPKPTEPSGEVDENLDRESESVLVSEPPEGVGEKLTVSKEEGESEAPEPKPTEESTSVSPEEGEEEKKSLDGDATPTAAGTPESRDQDEQE